MAKQRYINTRFWDDGYIVTLDPIEKLLFFYFLTNPLTEISGAYEIQLKRVALDTGIDRDMVQKILNRFADDDKIIYRDGWIYICNFIKHQSDSEKINIGIVKLVNDCPNWIKDRVRIEHRYRIDSVSHLIEYNRDVDRDSIEAASPREDEVKTEMTGRAGIPRTEIPINPSSDLEVTQWLDAVAPAMGAKSRFGLTRQADWAKIIRIAISEKYALTNLLMTLKRILDSPDFEMRFFKPDRVLDEMRNPRNGTNKRPDKQTPGNIIANRPYR